MSRVTGLLGALATNPADSEAAAVLADWCEECGFEIAAAGLRAGHVDLAHVQALSCLRGLFGARDPKRGTAPSYDYVQPFASMTVEACDRATIVLTASAPFRMRRIVMADTLTTNASVCRVRAGEKDLVAGADVDLLPGELFGSSSPDLFDEVIRRGSLVRVEVQNESRYGIYIRMAALGMRLPV